MCKYNQLIHDYNNSCVMVNNQLLNDLQSSCFVVINLAVSRPSNQLFHDKKKYAGFRSLNQLVNQLFHGQQISYIINMFYHVQPIYQLFHFR